MKNNSCKFCNITNGEYLFKEIDKPIAENDSFIAIASIGALVEGWTLIMPKKHTLSMKEYYGSPIFELFVNQILNRIYPRYGKVIIFEHGANTEGSITSCGTDHAHLHIVPFNDSLLPEMFKNGLNWEKIHGSEICDVPKHSEYLFYCELNNKEAFNNPQGYLHILKNPISQYFRKIIASCLGMAERSDYKKYYFEENALVTKRNLSKIA